MKGFTWSSNFRDFNKWCLIPFFETYQMRQNIMAEVHCNDSNEVKLFTPRHPEYKTWSYLGNQGRRVSREKEL